VQSLPLKCQATYFANFLSEAAAVELFDEIVCGFDVTNKIMKMYDGSEHTAETGSYIFADAELTSYSALPEVWGGRSEWTDSLATIRDNITRQTGVRFQVVRCIYYRDGSEGVDFHQDFPAYGNTNEIASLSLGAEREFLLRNVSDHEDRYSIRLASGSLLFMGEGTQQRYEHALPHDKSCHSPRLNLTFRKFG
jgi:alkylated DNA repair dioxygenase AlkB